MSASPGDHEFIVAMGPVARELLGEPTENNRAKRELRFGTRGSLSISLDKGTFYDHEAGEGGGVIDLLRRLRSLDKDSALAWLRERGHISSAPHNGAKLGKKLGKIVATYDYTDANGDPLFQVVRFEPKNFRQRQSDGNGGWVWNMKGVQRVIYRLPDVIAAVADGRTVFVVEGEKAADALTKLGVTATCSPEGAGKWCNEYAAHFKGADVVVLPDNDPQATLPDGTPRWHPDGRPVLPGQDHAAGVAQSLRNVAASVRVLMLPDLPTKGDAADWITAGGTREAIESLAAAADTDPEPEPEETAENESTEPPIPPDDPQQAEIDRLAALPELEFERIRKTEAERLGLSIGILSRAVARARRAAKAEAKAAKAEAKAEAKACAARAKADEKTRKTTEARARLDAQKAPPLTDDGDDPLHGWTPPSSNTLPEIIVAPGERPAIADAALAAMAAARVPFYQRDRDIVRVCLIKSRLSDGTMVCVPAISVVTVPMLMRALGLCATWYAYTKEFDLVQIDPPSDLGDHILGMIGEWPFPPLRGVIATQTMRYDGSLLTKPGYDRATGLVLFNPPPMPPIPDQPTKNDALEALALLRNLIDEVAFADDDNVSLSGAISMLMTPVLRGMMAVAPMHVVTKPSAGSGGSYMQDITAAIALGERCPVLSLTQRNDEENAKVLSSAALTGQPLIAIDNFTGTLMGDFLCQLIERPMPQVRILGRSQVVTIANNHCVMANGNNVTTGSDAIRRTVHISLDANVENPESRTFTHNPVAEVLADRGRYVAAILIIARAYRVAGVPGKLPPRLSFEDWSNNVRSALVWLGWPDPDESIKAVRAADPITAKLHAVIAAWATDLRADRSYLTSELVAEAAEYLPSSSDRIRPAMWDALFAIAGTKTGHLDVLRLGQWLQAHLNRISGGYKLLVDRTNKARPRWRLEPR